MRGLTEMAMRDYNQCVESAKAYAAKYDIDTHVFTVKCGNGSIRTDGSLAGVINETVNANLQRLQPLREYIADGWNTPLIDSVGRLITLMEQVPDKDSQEVAFLINVITDGLENASSEWLYKFEDKLRELIATDRWSFTFRVPRGHTRYLVDYGVQRGNILEWDQTEAGLRDSTRMSASALGTYYAGRTKGIHSTSTFYANMDNVSPTTLKRNLVDISGDIQVWHVKRDATIRDFVEAHNNGIFQTGHAFYQLTKSVKVQPYKKMIVLDKMSMLYYGGEDARRILGLDIQGDIRVRPGDHGQYEIFIQSTSVNRKLLSGTKVVYWEQ
jgi:hypothetical protein